MTPTPVPLRMYGQPVSIPPLDWEWVEEQLRSAATYWVAAAGPGQPHPRPVWAVWHDGHLFMSLGTPEARRALEGDGRVTVHLDSGLDVVIVEGTAAGSTADPALLRRYDEKYDWVYDAERYGPLAAVAPSKVLAWRVAGPAGREGFRQGGAWQI